MANKKYYIGLDIIRIISCIGVLLYHMGYLKGGFLAVCTFFVLTGYLSCVSSYNKEKFSILSYYKKLILSDLFTIYNSSLFKRISYKLNSKY